MANFVEVKQKFKLTKLKSNWLLKIFIFYFKLEIHTYEKDSDPQKKVTPPPPLFHILK